jgi:beta-galactosidase
LTALNISDKIGHLRIASFNDEGRGHEAPGGPLPAHLARHKVREAPVSLTPKIPHVLYGGDYNPEQWPEEVWQEDVRLMREAGVNLVSVGVFSWAQLEPEPGRYDFGWLDRVLDLLAEHGIFADLATATASPPPWLARRHPQSLPVTRDGTTLWPGARQHYCPSNLEYREAAAALVERLAERYANHRALALWHVNNEYGCHVAACYCDRSAEHFRDWLRERHGSLARLNDAWGTAFWSQQYGDWDEILPPRSAPTWRNPSQELDWHRFCSDALLALYLMEWEILERLSPGIPITTNFMRFFKPCDYWKWAQHVDFTAEDVYPDPADEAGALELAAAADLMRSLKGGRPWLVMEQAPNAVNWRQQNVPKHPGQLRLGSYQSLARGADGIMFFQWRASKAGAEKFHSGMIPHAGTATRTWREVVELGRELARLDGLLDTRVPVEVALLFDWESWWALELPSKPSHDLLLMDQVAYWYRHLWKRNLTVDFAHPEGDLSRYRLVIAPNLYLVSDAGAENLEEFVAAGGTLLISFFSAIVDERDHIRLGGYPAPFRRLLGIAVPEVWPHAEGETHQLTLDGERHSCALWSDWIELEGAEAVAVFEDGWLSGRPALTRKGSAWYLGTRLDAAAMEALVAKLAGESRVLSPLDAPAGVEVVQRDGDEHSFLFLLNHGARAVTVAIGGGYHDALTGDPSSSEATLGPHGVIVLRRQASVDPDGVTAATVDVLGS